MDYLQEERKSFFSTLNQGYTWKQALLLTSKQYGCDMGDLSRAVRGKKKTPQPKPKRVEVPFPTLPLRSPDDIFADIYGLLDILEGENDGIA